MKRVLRFKIPFGNIEEANKVGVDIAMPKDAKIVRVAFSASGVSLWAEVKQENEATLETRTFGTFLTGQPIKDDPGFEWEYQGTCDNPAVKSVHVYEMVAKA